jgi:monoamine oxidase
MPLNRRQFLLAASALVGAGAALRAHADDADVLVLGAGLSGLSAALTLQQAGARVQVVESRERVGGRVLSFADVPGVPEAGGQSIGPGYGMLMTAARRFQVALEDRLPSQQRHSRVELVLGGEVIAPERWPSSPRNPFPEAEKGMLPWQYAAALLSRGNPLAPGTPWYAPANAVHDRPLHDFLLERGASEAAIKLAYDTNPSYGTSARDISALQLMFIDAWTGMQRRMRPAAVFKAVGGNQRIPEAMAAGLQREVLLRTRAVSLRQDAAGVTVTCDDGRRLKARLAICALPFTALRKLSFEPRLTGVQQEAVQKLPYQQSTQVALVARRPFWKDDGLSPSMWCDSLLSRTFAHHEDDEVVSILVTAYGNKATALDRLGREGAIRRVIAEFEAARPAARGQLQGVAWHSWGLDRDAGGSWAVFAPGTVTRFLPAMSAPHGRVHFCGEHTALTARGMEGAMESGQRAAMEALRRL